MVQALPTLKSRGWQGRGMRGEKGEGREVAGCSTLTELEAMHGGGRCGGRGKGKGVGAGGRGP
jgi:hypothetical protein